MDSQDKTRFSVQRFDQFAREYATKFTDQSAYQAGLDRFCAEVGGKNARVLELGCGPGNVTRYLLDQGPDFRWLGIDMAPRMIELARQNVPEADFREMDCRDIGQLSGSFDGVFAGFCLPYISREEARQLFRDTAQLLAPGGIFYLSTMEDDYDRSGYQSRTGGAPEIHIYYHEGAYLVEYLQENGFEIISETRQPYLDSQSTTEWNDLVLIARKTTSPSS